MKGHNGDKHRGKVLGNLALRAEYGPEDFTARQAPLSRQNSALVELSRSRKIHSGDLGKAVKEITETAARTLEVARVGVWLYDAEHTEIYCINQYCRESNHHSQGVRLKAESFPNYFRALDEARTIAADNALTDSRTREFSESYLIPFKISSMLDAPIRMRGQLVGVVCHEHVGDGRRWALDERQFAGSIADFVCMAIEAAEKSTAEAALRSSEERVRSLLDNVPDIILRVDREGRILFINRTEPQYDPDSVIGQESIGYIKEEHRDLFRTVLKNAFEKGETQYYELDSVSGRNYSSRLIPVKNGSEIASCLLIATDVTERKQAEHDRLVLETQLQQTQKLECLGMLAGGIAHDFNNLLVGILGNTSLVLESPDIESSARQRLQTIKKTAQRAAELVNQLLAYSGKASLVPVTLDLSALTEELSELLETSISKRVNLTLNLARSLPCVKADPTQLRQVIMNLIVNAAEACEEGRGEVEVRTREIKLNKELQRSSILGENLTSGDYVAFEVEDNGCGMSEDCIKRIFDPFFSTKLAGRGLGLAAVLGIVRSHFGAINVRSTPGRGTTFSVILPVSDDVDAPVSPQKAKTPILNLPSGKSILVIDDDPIVREVTEAIINSFGLNVITADRGSQGVELFTAHAGEIAAVLVDMTMPDINGEEVFRRLRAVRGGLPIIMLSGYTEEYAPETLAGEKNYAFLQKPYTPDDLLAKLSQIIPEE